MKITNVEALYLRAARDQGAHRQLAGRAADPHHHRCRHRRLGRGRRLPLGGQGDRRGAHVAHARHRPAPHPHRRGSDGDRAALGQDVPGHALLRPRGCGDPGHGRDRPRLVGHQGQGAQDAGLAGDRRPLPRPAAGLRLEHDAVHARGQRRAGAQGQGRGLHRGQVRLGAVRQGRQDRLPIPGRHAQGRGRRVRPDARRGPGLGRDHDHPARQAVRAVRPVLDRGAAAAGRSRRLRARSAGTSCSGWPPARRSAPFAGSSA